MTMSVRIVDTGSPSSFRRPEKSDFSVQPLCSLCLCGCFYEQFFYHKGTEDAEIAQRRSSLTSAYLCDLCVTVVTRIFNAEIAEIHRDRRENFKSQQDYFSCKAATRLQVLHGHRYRLRPGGANIRACRRRIGINDTARGEFDCERLRAAPVNADHHQRVLARRQNRLWRDAVLDRVIESGSNVGDFGTAEIRRRGCG